MTNEHNHKHHISASPKRVIWAVLVLNLVLLVAELVIGFSTGSLALLSDAAHMITDVLALSVALIAAYYAEKPGTLNKSFGFSSAEPIGAFANATVLLVACALIFGEAIHRLVSGVPIVLGWPVLVVGVIGLIVNLGSVWLLHRSDSNNLNIRGALAHMMADALGSVGAIGAAVLMILGFPIADPIISIVIACIILWNVRKLFKDCLRVLMGFAPDHINAAEVGKKIAELPGVAGVHDLHIWTLDGEFPLLTCHITTGADKPISILNSVNEMLAEEFNITHSTIQVEDLPEENCGRECRLC